MNNLDHLTNQNTLRKAFETGEFPSGDGLLNPEQQSKFIVYMKRFNVLLGLTRMVPMPQAVMDLDKLHISEPITRAASENSLHPSTLKPKTNKVTLVCKKMISSWYITTETLQENIEKANFEATLMQNLTQRIGVDYEQLGINGDESIVAVPGNAISELLSINDGWLKQCLDAHTIDLAGAPISRSVFKDMLNRMPKQYRNDPELRFIMSDGTFYDMQDLFSGGNAFAVDAGAVGSDAIAAASFNSMGGGLTPYGRRIIRVPLIPEDQVIAVPTATTYAYVDGTQYGPFKIYPGINDKLILTTDLGGPVTITFSVPAGGGVLDLVAVVSAIKAGLGAFGTALDNQEGKLRVRSLTDGAGSSITIASEVGGSTANSTLGFLSLGEIVPALAGVTEPVAEGTSMILTNPKNLVWGMLNQVRMFSEFNKDFDRIETVVYTQLDFKIENLDALVYTTGLRRA